MFVANTQACGWPTVMSLKFAISAFDAINDSVSYTDVPYASFVLQVVFGMMCF